MGALDGVLYSNTNYFARHAGWRGLLIEANPESYKNLVQSRKESICVNAAVCSDVRLVHYISSKVAAVSGIYEFMPETFIETWHKKVNSSDLPEIPCLPLMTILDW